MKKNMYLQKKIKDKYATSHKCDSTSTQNQEVY